MADVTKLITRNKKQKHIIFPEENYYVQPVFSFKLAVHVFCATKIGRKTRNYQNISQDNLPAEH